MRDALLEAVPDVWAERFLPAEPAKSLEELGLKNPDRVLTVTRPDGAAVTLEVGKPILDGPSSNRSYARLRGYDRVFEINSDKLTPIYVSLDALRDNQLARFKSEDAREIEIVTRKGKIVFRNTAPPRKPGDTTPAKSDWKLVEPVQSGADAALVERLLNALSGLSATDKDVAEKVRAAAAASATTLPAMAGAQASLLSTFMLDPARLAETYGLAPPAATIKVGVEESKGEGKPPAKRTVAIRLGRHDRIGKKLYAKSQDWPRINQIDDGLAELVLEKTSLDYRGRRLLDFLSFDVDRIEVRRPIVPSLSVVSDDRDAGLLPARRGGDGGGVGRQRPVSGRCSARKMVGADCPGEDGSRCDQGERPGRPPGQAGGAGLRRGERIGQGVAGAIRPGVAGAERHGDVHRQEEAGENALDRQGPQPGAAGLLRPPGRLRRKCSPSAATW